MKNRYLNMDFLRIVCAFAIVIIHVTSASLTYAKAPTNVATIAMHLSTILMAWAVPCFFMLTGFVWLGNEKECTYKTIGKHVLKFFVVLFTIGLFYAMLEIVYDTRTINIYTIFKSFINVLRGKLWDHMWYVYAVIGVYIVLPLLKPFFIRSKFKDDAIVLLLSFFYTIFVPILSDALDYSIPIKFVATGWIFYVMLGGVVGKYSKIFIERKCFVTTVCLISMLLSNTAIILKCINEPSFHVVSYTSLSVALMAAAVFVIFTVQTVKNKRMLLSVSSCCWGIYLIHPAFINLMIKVLNFNPIDYAWYISIPLTCVVIFALSAVIVWALRKIGIVRKFIL